MASFPHRASQSRLILTPFALPLVVVFQWFLLVLVLVVGRPVESLCCRCLEPLRIHRRQRKEGEDGEVREQKG